MSLIPTNINSATFAIMRNQLCANRKGGVLTNTDGEQNPFESADAPDADKVTVLYKTPESDVAVLRTVPNTLEAWQALVGNGYVEMVDDRIGDGVYILCNEEGLIIGLAPNFILRSRPDVEERTERLAKAYSQIQEGCGSQCHSSASQLRRGVLVLEE